jgi:hypothetical protein
MILSRKGIAPNRGRAAMRCCARNSAAEARRSLPQRRLPRGPREMRFARYAQAWQGTRCGERFRVGALRSKRCRREMLPAVKDAHGAR